MTRPKDWNNRKRQKPKIADKKLRGEWAEMVFMTRAIELGLPISKPWGEMQSYDFVVGRTRHFVSVQVKSTIAELGNGYVCTVRGGHKPYPPGSFDFLAAYVVHDNAWYIIPEEEIQGTPRRQRPSTRSIARRGTCSIPMLTPSRATSTTSTAAPKNSRRNGSSEVRRLLKHFPRFLRSFPQTSTGKFHPAQLLHKREMFFCCGPQHSGPEWVQRKRGILKACQLMIAVTPVADWQFSRVNCQGKFGNARQCVPVARAFAASSPARSLSRLDRWLPQGLQKK